MSLFDCGNRNLNNFLQYYALNETRHELSRTYLLIDINPSSAKQVAGYFTLQADSRTIYHPVREQDTSIPFAELTFLARDIEWRKKEIGPTLLIEALRCATLAAEEIGIFGVHLRPTMEGRRLYKKFGFEEATELPGRFWMPIAKVRATLQEPE